MLKDSSRPAALRGTDGGTESLISIQGRTLRPVWVRVHNCQWQRSGRWQEKTIYSVEVALPVGGQIDKTGVAEDVMKGCKRWGKLHRGRICDRACVGPGGLGTSTLEGGHTV